MFQNFPPWTTSYSHHISTNANQESTDDATGCKSPLPSSPETTLSPDLPLQIRQEVWNINDSTRESWVSSPHALRQYLRCTSARQRAEYWASIRNRVAWTELPIMLVQFMHGTEEGVSWNCLFRVWLSLIVFSFQKTKYSITDAPQN